MLLFTISFNLFIVLVLFGLALWGVYVLLFVGGRQQKKTKRPTPTAYTFFQPTAPGAGGATFTGTVPLSTVNTDELRFGMSDISLAKPVAAPPPLPQAPATETDPQADGIPDDNPDFAVLEDDLDEEAGTLAKTRQVTMFQATPVPVDSLTTTFPSLFELPDLAMLDEDVLDQVEAIFGNEEQMELLDYYHNEANRVMLLTGEDYHTVFYRLIQDESAGNRTYLTSMLVPADAPEYTTSLATVLAMGDEEEIDE